MEKKINLNLNWKSEIIDQIELNINEDSYEIKFKIADLILWVLKIDTNSNKVLFGSKQIKDEKKEFTIVNLVVETMKSYNKLELNNEILKAFWIMDNRWAFNPSIILDLNRRSGDKENYFELIFKKDEIEKRLMHLIESLVDLLDIKKENNHINTKKYEYNINDTYISWIKTRYLEYGWNKWYMFKIWEKYYFFKDKYNDYYNIDKENITFKIWNIYFTYRQVLESLPPMPSWFQKTEPSPNSKIVELSEAEDFKWFWKNIFDK